CADPVPVADPVQYWCQDNHILVITEGESTADINADVGGLGVFPVSTGDDRLLSWETRDDLNGDTGTVYDTVAGCGDSLYSNTSFDDMTWWGQHVLPLYRNRYLKDPDGNLEEKNTIYTHVVTTGTLIENGTDECVPEALMNAAAKNGGTDPTPENPNDKFYYSGENPDDLERNLYAVLGDIMSRASSGSAASVISDSRSGSGAMYQAVFWPQHEDNTTPTPNKVTWVGDVRSLLLDADGLTYEDTDQNGILNPANDREIVFYYNKKVGRTRGCYDVDGFRKGLDGIEGTADDYQCPGDSPCPDPDAANCVYVAECTAADDCVETMDVKYLWSANRQLRDMKTRFSPSERNIYTWNDVNNNGMVDSAPNNTSGSTGEWFKLNANTDWSALNAAAAAAGKRGKVTEDFLTPADWGNFVGNDSSKTAGQMELASMKVLTKWLLGEDQLDYET
ncbi:MAG: hypothetical protein D3922_12875, partial [Candidatus Electrothrix sp. AR1]|nr:hypothetical protein [Candidatus Electrothrix sp. AR1]